MHLHGLASIICFIMLAVAMHGQFSAVGSIHKIILAYVAANAVLAFWRPRWALLLFLFSLPLCSNMLVVEPMGHFPPSVILLLSFFIGFLLHRIYHTDLDRVSTPLNGPLTAYVAIGVCSAFITILRYTDFYPVVGDRFQTVIVNRLDETSYEAVIWAYRTLLVFLSGPAVFWAVLRLTTRKRHITQSLWALLAGMGFAVAFGVYQSLGHESLGNLPRMARVGRINATFTNTNALGAFFILAFPLVVLLLFQARRYISRLAALATFAAGIWVLGASGSRTGFLGVLVAMLIGALLFLSHKENRRLVFSSRSLLLLAGIFTLSLLALLGPWNSQRSRSLMVTRWADGFAFLRESADLETVMKNQRVVWWKHGLKVAAEFPLSGIGLGAFHTEIPNILEWEQSRRRYRDNTGNLYLQTSAEMGLIGLLYHLVVLAVILRESFRLSRRPSADWPTSLLVSLLCGSLTSMTILFMAGPHLLFAEVQILFWTLTAWVFAQRHAFVPPLAMQPASGEGPPEAPPPPGARFLSRISICVILLFVGLQGANSLTVLSNRGRIQLYKWEKSRGFYPWEKGENKERLRWTRKEAATIISTWRPLVNTTLFIGHPDAGQKPVTVEIFLEGQVVREEIFDEPEVTRSITLLLPNTENEQTEILFRVDRTYVPRRYSRSTPDNRELGVLVRDLQFLKVPEEEGFGFSEWREDEAGQKLRFATVERTAALPVRLDEGTRFEMMAAATPAPSGSAPALLRILANNTLVKEIILPDERWIGIRLDLGRDDGADSTLLRFEVSRPADSPPGIPPRPVRVTRPRPEPEG